MIDYTITTGNWRRLDLAICLPTETLPFVKPADDAI